MHIRQSPTLCLLDMYHLKKSRNETPRPPNTQLHIKNTGMYKLSKKITGANYLGLVETLIELKSTTLL